MSASVVAGVDAPPVFDFSEHSLDVVPLAIEGDAARDQGMAEPVGVIAPVTQQGLAFGKASIIS